MVLLDSVIVLAILAAVPATFSKRYRRMWRALFGMTMDGAEQANVPALIALAKRDLKDTEAKFNDALAEHAGQSRVLMEQVHAQESRVADLTKSVQFYLGKGDQATAGKFAAQLETVERQLHDNHDALEVAEQTYKTLKATRDTAVSKIEARIQKIADDNQNSELLARTNELQEKAAAMKASFSGSDDTISRLEEMVQKKKVTSIGRARVIADSPDTGSSDIPAEVTESSALDRFLAKTAPKQLNAPPAHVEPVFTRSEQTSNV